MTEKAKEARQIVVDVGSQRKKALRRLKAGTGKLALEVDAALDLLQVEEGSSPREIVPVVMLIEKRRRRAKRGRGGGLLSALLG
jgi:hypothetical protein